MNNRFKGLLILLPVIIFLLAFYYYPMLTIINLGLSNSKEIWLDTLENPLLLRFLGFTFIQTLLTIAGSLLVGLPAGYIIARKNPYFSNLLRSAITVPFIFPPLAILLGFVSLFGVTGVVSFLNFNPFSFWGIILAHIMYNISVIARISESAWANEPKELHVIAETLGASKFNRFKSITLPHLRPSLEAGVLLVFLYAFNSFAIVLILGEVRLQTLEVMIYSQSKLPPLNFETSSILVIIQLIINFIVLLIYSRRKYYQQTELNEIILPNKNKGKFSTIILIFIIFISWLPIIILMGTAIQGTMDSPEIFRTQLFSGSYDRLLGTSSLRVISNTLFFGLITGIMAIIFSTLMILALQFFKNEYKVEKFYIFFTLLPMATSAVSLSFALINTHGKFAYYSDLVWIFIIVAQLLAALPFASRTLLSSWKRVPTDLLLVSKTLSAPWSMSFEKVILPYMRSAFLVGFLFAFAISIGEFGATYYLSRGEWVTLSISIYKMFGSRTVILPYIYASMLIVTSLLVFLLIEKIGKLEMKL